MESSEEDQLDLRMSPLRLQLLKFQIIAVIGPFLLALVAAVAGTYIIHVPMRLIGLAVKSDIAVSLMGIFCSIILLHRHSDFRNFSNVLILFAGICLLGVAIAADWMFFVSWH
jgi:hypothetical protein